MRAASIAIVSFALALAGCANSQKQSSSAPTAKRTSAVASKPSAFDGAWNAEIKFSGNNGPECLSLDFGRGFSIASGEIDGEIHHADAGSFYLSGSISTDGTLADVSAQGADVVRLSGALDGASGGGSWQTDTYSCQGTWSATKKGA